MKIVINVDLQGVWGDARASQSIFGFFEDLSSVLDDGDIVYLAVDYFHEIEFFLESAIGRIDEGKIKIFRTHLDTKTFPRVSDVYQLTKNCFLESFSADVVISLSTKKEEKAESPVRTKPYFEVILDLDELMLFYDHKFSTESSFSLSVAHDLGRCFITENKDETLTSVKRLLPDVFTQCSSNAKKNETRNSSALDELIDYIHDVGFLNNYHIKDIAKTLGDNIFDPSRKPTLFLDASTLINFDHATGIQRVVKEISNVMLEDNKINCQLVYSYAGHEHFYFPKYESGKYKPAASDELKDRIVDFSDGDILLFLDLHPSNAYSKSNVIQKLRLKGIKSYFVVYDLLPVSHPHCFVKELVRDFNKWLQAVIQSNGALCISNDVSTKLNRWIKENNYSPYFGFENKYFHLGANFDTTKKSIEKPDVAELLDIQLSTEYSFLMVGTIEPRKGHSDVLDAFESLWAHGSKELLVIVGKAGWKNKKVLKRLRRHKERNKKLFWLENVSDGYLEYLYANCSCLIAASEGEGFGLPLIEAAHYKLPIIARDIPVFREVAGESALYFSGLQLKEKIEEWLELYSSNAHPKSELMKILSWEDSVQELLTELRWPPMT
jgi:glycosyltransferase involved in cell wall biosynthesis